MAGSKTADYVVRNIKRIAELQAPGIKAAMAKPRVISEREQVKRFVNGTYRRWMDEGRITGQDYARMTVAMGKLMGYTPGGK